MGESDSLSKYNNIPLSHNRIPMAPFTLKSTSKLRSALHFRYSIVIRSSFPALILLKPNNHYTCNYVFL